MPERVREALIGSDEPEAWARALEGVPHGFDHGWVACRAAALNTGRPTWLYVAERDGVRVVCPFSERWHDGALDLVTPRGFSGFAANGLWPGFAAHWAGFARERGAVCGYFAQHPAFGEPAHEGPSADGTPLYLLDLQDGAEATIARARKGRRRELRAWAAHGNGYVEDRARLAGFALAQHGTFMDRVGGAAAARLNEAALRLLLESPGTHLVGAGPGDGSIEAVLLLGATPWGGEGVFNVGLPAGRRHTVALLAWGLRALAAAGVPWLNLGGGVREDDALVAAKREWNPRVAPFRRLKQVYRPQDYAALCAAAGVDPASEGWFPAYHRLR